MNFGAVLHTALKNDKQNAKKEIRYYSTKFEPPKKEQRSKSLSVNVQKFLARKEEEERKKAEEAQKRKEKLLELRSHDKKASRRVNVMLKRTKSANQSVIQDAVDRDNTAVTLAGPSQPDEDDYGYVSQNAADFYNKMMEKYNSMPPEEPKFPTGRKKVSTNLSSTKDRVKAALEREKEEAMQPHRRKRRSHHKDEGEAEGGGGGESPDKYESEPIEKEEKKPSKPKIKAAPVINFADLLKIAEKKQFEPIVIEQKEKEEERLYTKRQKRELEKEREYRERREQRAQQGTQPPPPVNKIPKTAEAENKTPKAQSEHRIPTKSNGDVRTPKPSADGRPTKPSNLNDKTFKVPREVDRPKPAQPQRSDDRSKAPQNRLPQKRPLDGRPSSDRPAISNTRDQILQNALEGKRDPKDRKQYVEITKPRLPPPPVESRPKQLPSKAKPAAPSRQLPPPDSRPKQVDLKRKLPPPAANAGRPKQFPPSDLKPKQFPPPDLKPKQFPPGDVYRPKKKPLISKGRFYDDDDEEDDSEMDDFIDDGPEEGEDYSKYISEIFGYDKKKYSYMDDDVDDMETSFAQQMREEVISTKIGIMEDLEDMRQEEEQKKKKAMMKKRLK